MASVAFSLTNAEQIEEELLFQQTLLRSLEDIDDDDPQIRAIQSVVDELERRLVDLNSSDRPSPESNTGDNTPPEDSDDCVSLTGGIKRFARTTSDGAPPSKRVKNSAQATLERYRQVEEQARLRREREETDAAFARLLSAQQYGGNPDASSSSSTPAALSRLNKHYLHQLSSPYTHPAQPRPTTHTGDLRRQLLHSHAPSPHQPQATRHEVPIDPTHIKHESSSSPTPPMSRPVNDVVDLTGEDDDVIEPPARVHGSSPSTLADRNVHHISGSANPAMTAQQAALMVRSRQAMARTNPGMVYHYSHQYPMPGAFPASSYAPEGIQSARSIYEPQRSQPSRPSYWTSLSRNLEQYGSDLTNLFGGLPSSDLGLSPSRIRADLRSDAWAQDDDMPDDADVTEDLINLMNNIRPDEDIPVEEQGVDVPSMTVKLKPYQGAGLTWLQKMEDSTNQGSILADDMGLGKTVQAIALMTTRRSTSNFDKTNLIIAPVALLRQWKEEIITKLKRGGNSLSVFIHHGTTKKKSHGELRQFDVVITTFGTIGSEMRKRDRFLARKEQDPRAGERPEERCIFIGEHNHWYRVIVDEAQNIKNRNTQSARGACHINARFRLCMTGTPIMNNVDELHSLIRFLRIKPYRDLTKFSQDFSRPLKSGNDDNRAAAMQRLQALLKAILLRRHKKSTINGKPILILPERIVQQTVTEFSEEERDFYKALETQSRIQFNKYAAANTVGRSYAHILVMLLRLRQACCHPHLVKDFAVAAASDISEEDMTEFARSLEHNVVERIKTANGEFECPVCYDAVENPAIFVPCGHDTCAECYVKIKDASQSNDTGDGTGRAKCPNCRGIIDPKQVIDYETFKRVHMPAVEEVEALQLEAPPEARSDTDSDPDSTESEADEDSSTDSGSEDSETSSLNGFVVGNDDDVKESRGHGEKIEREGKGKGKAKMAPIFGSRPRGLKFEDSEDGDESEIVDAIVNDGGKTRTSATRHTNSTKKAEGRGVAHKGGSRRKGKGKSKSGMGKGKAKKEDKKKSQSMSLAELKRLASRSKPAKREYLRRLRRDYVPSAKVDRCVELLKEIVDDTDEKIIIFSQWTSLLDLLEVPINDEKWKYQRYDGSMSARDRADAIDDFKSPNKGVRMMLVSLKAGNAGLNLNCASQVIILDPFWNPYIEEQAIDRAHRLGQEREVRVHRLLVEQTVEDRIMALQEQKRAMVNEALDEGAGQRLSRLNQAQLGYLFGVRGALPDP